MDFHFDTVHVFSDKYAHNVEGYTDKICRLNAQVKRMMKLTDQITGICCEEENSRYYNTNHVVQAFTFAFLIFGCRSKTMVQDLCF